MKNTKHEPWMYQLEKGHNYLFETHNKLWLGTVHTAGGHYVVIDNAIWVANTGRFHNFLRDGVFDSNTELEVTGLPEGLYFTNWHPWIHPLPTETR